MLVNRQVGANGAVPSGAPSYLVLTNHRYRPADTSAELTILVFSEGPICIQHFMVSRPILLLSLLIRGFSTSVKTMNIVCATCYIALNEDMGLSSSRGRLAP